MYRIADVQPGDILLMQSRLGSPWYDQWLDAGIRWSTDSPWVHACLVGPGVLINPLWHVQTDALDAYADNGSIFRPQATSQQKECAIAWAMTHIGQRYGLDELLLDAARFDLHWTPRLRHHLQLYTCSGFTVMAYRQARFLITYAPFPAPCDVAYSPVLGRLSS